MGTLLEGKVAVVTGSGRGIGRGIALALGAEGAKVVVNDVGCATDGRGTDADPAAAVCKELKNLGTEGVPSYDSVAEFDNAGGIIRTALDTWGRCDILVNNAGILRDKQLVNMSRRMPALLTRMSQRPQVSRAVLMILPALSNSATLS